MLLPLKNYVSVNLTRNFSERIMKEKKLFKIFLNSLDQFLLAGDQRAKF
jgi:hypothetical protein